MSRNTFVTKKYWAMLGGGTISCFIVSLLLLSDFVVAGIFLGGTAIAGVNLVSPIYSLSMFVGLVFSIGIPILYSRAVGNFQREEADRCFGLGLTSTVAVGLLLFVVLFFTGDSYIRFYDVSPEISSQASAYFSWMRLTIMLLPVTTFLSDMIFVDGDEILSTAAGITEAVVNIVASILLCRRIGIAGVGLGSVIGQLASLAVCLLHFTRDSNTLRPNLYFSWKKLISVVRYSMMDAGTYLFIALFTAFANKYLVWRFGPDTVAMVAVITFVKDLQLAFDGIGIAIQPIISTYLAEKCYDGVRKIWKLGKITALAEGFLAAAALFFLAPVLPGVLGFTDAKTVSMAVTGLRILSFSLPFMSLLYLITSYYLLADRIALGVVICALRDVVLAVPLILLLGGPFGMSGVFVAAALSPAAAWLLSMLWVCLRMGRENWPLLLKDRESLVREKLFEFTVSPAEIIQVRNRVEAMLRDEGVPRESVARCLLVFEETFMMICDGNPGATVRAECVIVLEQDRIRLIGRDDGRPLDLSDVDSAPDSFRAYTLSRFTSQKMFSAVHMMAVSFNRNMFEMVLTEKKAHE